MSTHTQIYEPGTYFFIKKVIGCMNNTRLKFTKKGVNINYCFRNLWWNL